MPDWQMLKNQATRLSIHLIADRFRYGVRPLILTDNTVIDTTTVKMLHCQRFKLTFFQKSDPDCPIYIDSFVMEL